MIAPLITAAELEEFRAEAEARMTSRVRVRRSTGRTAQSETTGRQVPIWATVHADLPFRLKGGRSGTVGATLISIGGVEFEEATAEGQMPAATHDLADNDLLEVTAGEWPDTVWRIVKAVKGDQRTACRVPIVEAPRPAEWDTP